MPHQKSRYDAILHGFDRINSPNEPYKFDNKLTNIHLISFKYIIIFFNIFTLIFEYFITSFDGLSFKI